MSDTGYQDVSFDDLIEMGFELANLIQASSWVDAINGAQTQELHQLCQ